MYSRIIGTGSYLPERVLANAELEGMVDRGTCVLFGDGAGTVVLGPSEQPGILSTHLRADGAHADLLFYPTGPSRTYHPGVQRQNVIHMKRDPANGAADPSARSVTRSRRQTTHRPSIRFLMHPASASGEKNLIS